MEYKGFSNGMKPDAAWRVLLWMRSTAITAMLSRRPSKQYKQCKQTQHSQSTQPELGSTTRTQALRLTAVEDEAPMCKPAEEVRDLLTEGKGKVRRRGWSNQCAGAPATTPSKSVCGVCAASPCEGVT